MAFADGPARPRPRLRRAARGAARASRASRATVELVHGARAAPGVRADHAADPARGRRRADVRRPDRVAVALGRAARGRRRRRCAPRSPSRAGERARLLAALGVAPRTARRPRRRRPTASRERIEDTVEAWRSWEAEHDVYEGPHRELVRHSARVLKGLTYRPTGAIVAAPTTSLPETVGGERNWDYRFSWIRDSSLTLEALYIGACSDEAEEFVSFMTSAAGGRAGEGSLQIMYGIGGEHDLSERELAHLRGWRDSRPVRVGNGAWNQVQLDVYGELLNALHLYRERLGDLHPEIQAFVADLADTAARRWTRDRLGHLGDARRAAPPPVLEGHVLGRARPRREARAAARRARQGRGVGRGARRDPRGDPRARLERGAPGLRAVVRLRRARRRAAADADLRLPAGDRRADALDDRGDRPRPDRGRPRAALPRRGGPERRRADRRGGHVRDLLVLARRRAWRRRARSSAPRRCSTSSPATRTTSACSARRSTRPTASSSATSRRPSATSG